MIRGVIFIVLYLLNISWVRSDCESDVLQQLQAIHNEASDVTITWIGDKPSDQDVFHAVEGRHVSMKPHVFVLVCADGKQYRGRAEPCYRVPVMTKDVKKGDLLQDIDHKMVPCRLVGKKAIHNEALLAGMQARVNLKAQQPIQEHQVAMPRLIKKNEIITVQYQTPFFVITNQGVAERDGALGDMITVTCQKKTFNARVVSNQLVQIDRL